MENENKSTVSWTPQTDEQKSFLSKIKWFFQKSDNTQKDKNSGRLTKTFHFTRKDSIISILVAIFIVWGAMYYWKVVFDEYRDINNRAEELKNLSSYSDANMDMEKVFANTELDNNSTIEDLISTNNNIQERIKEDKTRK